ncbi:hypothetical protein TrispH2_007979 [Trichoplax sp. H2]|nr:hypothetical protein TrispH2_007979 [Trichoplax sp. H2]|eukprot:RDD40111.1 hypothetical protein TrispH2_007979 [Trichoplax sp. H2]
MLRTILFFGAGGIWVACFSNGLRHHRLFRKPQTHVLYTLIGLAIGYQVHKYEENTTARYERMMRMKPYVTRMVQDISDKGQEN